MEGEKLDRLVKAMNTWATSGPVCDAIFKCEGWEIGLRFSSHFSMMLKGINFTGLPFKFCPWCGKEIFVEKSDS